MVAGWTRPSGLAAFRIEPDRRADKISGTVCGTEDSRMF
jgi:hypothetical protein